MHSGPRLLFYSVVLIAFVFLDSGFLVALYQAKSHGSSDFASFYAAGKIVAEHHGPNLYSIETQAEMQQRLFPSLRASPLLFNHLPYEVLIFLPFTRWSFPVAHAAWFIFRIVLLGIAYLLLLRNLDRLRPLRPWLLLMSLSFPAVADLVYGQDATLLLLIYALAFDTLARDKQFGAGCLMALGLFKYQFVAPFVLLFVRKLHWKMVVGFMLTTAAVLVTSVSIVGVEGANSYVGMLRGQMWHMPEAAAASSPIMMPNIRGFVFASLRGHVGRTALDALTFVLSLLVLVASVKCVPKRAWSDPHQIPLLFSLATITTVLVSYHAHLYDLTLLAVPVLVLANGAEPEHRVPLTAAVLGPPVYMVVLWYGCGNLLCPVLVALAVWTVIQLRTRATALETRVARHIPTSVGEHSHPTGLR